MMWMLARLYSELPEVGDVDRPKLVFFFDEAHLLFDGASKAFLEQIEQVVKLIRSKGVGVFFVTQSPKDISADVLGQLGHRVQHALRAFTPDDEKALRAAARTFPKTEYYDVEETLTTLGIGEALITVLDRKGRPSPPFATRLIPPLSRMSPLTDDEMTRRLAASQQVKDYAEAVDNESAREKLEAAAAETAKQAKEEGAEAEDTPARGGKRRGKAEPTGIGAVLNSPLVRDVARQMTRSLFGALVGPTRRRSTRRRSR
jgi:hypothetical protein